MNPPVLDTLLRACVAYPGGAPALALVEASQDFIRQARADPGLLRQAALAAESLPVIGAGWVAMLIGGAVEDGADAAATFDGLWRVFLACCEAPSSEAGASASARAVLEQALRLLGPGLVTHLAHLPEHRAAILADAASFERMKSLAAEHVGAFWVCEAVERSSADLLLLHPTSRSGWRARYDNVAQCFHLFSLLQAAVGTTIPGGRPPDAALAAAARGEPHDVPLADEAWWHYQSPLAPTPHVVASIPGDLLTRHIPLVDGVQVLLLWPPILAGRGWSAGSFGAHLQQLPAGFALKERLATEECDAWFARLGIAAAPVAAVAPKSVAGASPAATATPKGRRTWWKPW